jgi:hypothetical protein
VDGIFHIRQASSLRITTRKPLKLKEIEMLYDKRWEKPEVKADPFSLESLIAWLEKQPAQASYDSSCIHHCMLAQWIEAMGVTSLYEIAMRSFELGEKDGPFKSISGIGENRRVLRTFGAALERARKAQCTTGDGIMMFHVGQKVVLIGWREAAVNQWKAAYQSVNYPNVGDVYTVRAVKPYKDSAVLLLKELDNSHIDDWGLEPGFRQDFFRPAVEPKADISIFTAMLKKDRQPVLVGSHGHE